MITARIDLREIPGGESALTRELPAEAVGLTSEERTVDGLLRLEADVYRDDDDIQIRGLFAAPSGRAARGARPGSRRRLELELFVMARRVPETGAEEFDDDSVIDHDGQTLDLSDTIRQLVVISAPMAPVCREDCQGLCPHCGTDLNHESCNCELSNPDPRWQVIDDLLKKSRPEPGA